MDGVKKDSCGFDSHSFRMIKQGNIVKPTHCIRSKYMNSDFLKWIDQHKEERFYVESSKSGVVRLAKVGFAITEEFLEVWKK